MEVLHFCINEEAIPDDDPPRAIRQYKIIICLGLCELSLRYYAVNLLPAPLPVCGRPFLVTVHTLYPRFDF